MTYFITTHTLQAARGSYHTRRDCRSLRTGKPGEVVERAAHDIPATVKLCGLCTAAANGRKVWTHQVNRGDRK